MQESIDQRFAEVNTRLDQMNARLDEMDARTTHDRDELKAITIKGYIIMITRENGAYQQFDELAEVPFPNGMFPWGKEVDGPNNTRVTLPELRSLDAIKNLTPPQLYGFFQGYYPGEPLPPTARCREKILFAIGRGKDLHLL
ncbi:hypothetical protein GSI_05707 [Ganoderma sinense ZZ0214-1]|uniref:Mug135-like C-terminal domain-containing protein n=1 Tax=Ganoderma sinense ZZ0214-1 TaxID=1077348 RepID=A0A2G8SB70_9APHY|nr:hypothetical protein GSI_05707 [Ganoderma sinense ZZ0214-1]